MRSVYIVLALFCLAALAAKDTTPRFDPKKCKKGLISCANSRDCCSFWGKCGQGKSYCGTKKYQCQCDCYGKNSCRTDCTPATMAKSVTVVLDKYTREKKSYKAGQKVCVWELNGKYVTKERILLQKEDIKK